MKAVMILPFNRLGRHLALPKSRDFAISSKELRRRCGAVRVASERKGEPMRVPHLVMVLLASCTWASFTVMMRSFFRCADQKTPAKTFLTVSALVCTLVQLAGVIRFRPQIGLWGWVGLGCFVLANVVFWWALSSHGKARPAFAFIPTAPASLTRSGPYRIIRHPIYTAYLLSWSAAPLATGQLWLLLPIAWMLGLYIHAAWQEEKSFATSPYAADYAAYRKRTGMFLPMVTALVGLPAGRG
jgi:protein-S-isoprenylcysteine O-methyltransferase Ste14